MTGTPMTPDRLAEFRNRKLDEVTAGPWLVADGSDGCPVIYVETLRDGRAGARVLLAADGATEADMQFIASARQSVPELLAEVDRLRGELSDATGRVDFLERNTLPDLHRQIEHHKDGKPRWRERAEAAESRLTAVELLAEEADDKCNSTIDTDLLLDALGLNADAPSGARPTGLPVGLTGRTRHDARVAIETARKMRRRAGACFTCGDVPDEWCPDCACCKAGCDGGRTNNPCTHPNASWNTKGTR